jgi:hypothetical protein
MPFKPTDNTYTPEDMRKLQEELRGFPSESSRASVAKALMKSWGKTQDCMERWILIALSFGPSVLDAFERGKINRDRLLQIARFSFRMPSWKNFLAEKVIEENIPQRKINKIRDLIYAGRHPQEAIDIVLGRRSEEPITRKEMFSIEVTIKEIEAYGIDWRKKWEFLRTLIKGNLNTLQNGKYRDRLFYDAVAMKVAADDISRFANELVGEIPKEIMKAIHSEITGIFVQDDGPKKEPDVFPRVEFVDEEERESVDVPGKLEGGLE